MEWKVGKWGSEGIRREGGLPRAHMVQIQ